MKNAKYSFMGVVTLLAGLSLTFGVAESAERLPTALPVFKGGQKMVVPDAKLKSIPSAASAGTVSPAYPPPKGIYASGTLSAVGPRVDTSQQTFSPPISVNIANALSAIGPRIDTSSISFDPPKNITVTTPLMAVGPR